VPEAWIQLCASAVRLRFSPAQAGGAGVWSNALVVRLPQASLGVEIAPELLQATQNGDAAVGPRIPSRTEAIQQVIREGLVARLIFVIGNAVDVAIVRARCAVAHVEIVANGEYSLAGSAG